MRAGSAAFLLFVCVVAAAAQEVAPPGRAAAGPARTRYSIDLKLDFDARTYEGTQRVRWVNRDGRPTNVLYFHLYANHRPQADDGGRAQASANGNGAASPAQPDGPDEPRVEVTEARSAATNQPLAFTLDEQRVTLRVQLREAVPPGGAAELFLSFRGSLPEIDADETSLSAHVVQQVSAVLRDSREWRRARDTNFSSRGRVLLGAFHPVLAARHGDDWQRRVESGVGDIFHTEAADYEVTVEAPSDVSLYTSGEQRAGRDEPGPGGGERADAARPAGDGAERPRVFFGEGLRSFAVVAGRGLRVAEQVSAGVRVRSVYAAEHERVGRRVLGVAAEALRVFAARFGEPPYKTVTIAEAPLVAGLGNAEFTGLGVVASAFYVDFDAPSTRHLPPLVREQRASVEDSLEFTVAHLVAHQWWGAAVGSDPGRVPFMTRRWRTGRRCSTTRRSTARSAPRRLRTTNSKASTKSTAPSAAKTSKPARPPDSSATPSSTRPSCRARGR